MNLTPGPHVMDASMHVLPRFGLLMGIAVGSMGCNSQSIWLLKFDKTSPADCESGIEHNFTNAFVPELGDEWTDVSEVQRANDIAFAQLIEAGRGVGILIIGEQAFPGERDGNDWLFTWTDALGTADGQQHISGYGYFEYTETTTEWDIRMNTDRGETTGELEQIDLLRDTWRESDVWNDAAANTVGYTGQIPASTMLVINDPELGFDVGATNVADSAECASTPDEPWCEIVDITLCETSRKFTATRTRLDDEAAYSSLAGVSGAADDQ